MLYRIEAPEELSGLRESGSLSEVQMTERTEKANTTITRMAEIACWSPSATTTSHEMSLAVCLCREGDPLLESPHMPLSAGARIGSYEIVSPIGAGGMGEVYRARDTRLNRDVALKVLPEAFTLDPDRLARFKREAQVLASLNHPHIGAI